MKALIVLFLVLTVTPYLLAVQANDSNEYEETYKFILNDSAEVQNYFNEFLKRKAEFCLSDQIVYLPKDLFFEEMIEYEYPCLDNTQRKNLEKELFKSDMLDAFETYTNSNLRNNNQNQNCNLKIFFSKIIENKLIAVVAPSERGNTYAEILRMEDRFLFYLFYFKDGKIIKVMKQEIYH